MNIFFVFVLMWPFHILLQWIQCFYLSNKIKMNLTVRLCLRFCILTALRYQNTCMMISSRARMFNKYHFYCVRLNSSSLTKHVCRRTQYFLLQLISTTRDDCKIRIAVLRRFGWFDNRRLCKNTQNQIVRVYLCLFSTSLILFYYT